jgi:hypothetical protein
MRGTLLIAAMAFCANAWGLPPESPDAFARLKSLAGDWDADLPGYGKLTNTIRLVSNGKAIEETIGTPADNEVSIYTPDEGRILLTHFCAMTADGHQVRLETRKLAGQPDSKPDSLVFAFVGATNLHAATAPHMRKVFLTFVDQEHFSEKWTKTENGKDTVFDLNFVRRPPKP